MYIVTYKETKQEYSPPYDYHDNGKGSYHPVTYSKYVEFSTLELASQFIIENKDSMYYKEMKLFKAEEVPYKIELTVNFRT